MGRLSLGFVAAAIAVAATLAASILAGVSAYLLGRNGTADNLFLGLLLLRPLLSKICCSSCPSPSCSCGSCSSCSNPDSLQASKSNSFSSSVAGISESNKLCLSLLLELNVSHADRSQPAKCFGITPGHLIDLDESEPALLSGNCHIPSGSDSDLSDIVSSHAHKVLVIGPPHEVDSSSSSVPAILDCNVVSLSSNHHQSSAFLNS